MRLVRPLSNVPTGSPVMFSVSLSNLGIFRGWAPTERSGPAFLTNRVADAAGHWVSGSSSRPVRNLRPEGPFPHHRGGGGPSPALSSYVGDAN
jgi:hypothetical protein